MRSSTYMIAALISVVASTMSVATLFPGGSPSSLTGLGPQEFCFETPYPVEPSQCGCPTAVAADICIATKPAVGEDTVTGYYCLSDPEFNCTPNGLSCGGVVYVCTVSRCAVSLCQDGIDNDNDMEIDELDECAVPPGIQCTVTVKTGFCTNSYGCTDIYIGGGGGGGGPPL